MNWLETSPANAASWVAMGPVIRAGSRPGSPSSSIVTPIARSAAN